MRGRAGASRIILHRTALIICYTSLSNGRLTEDGCAQQGACRKTYNASVLEYGRTLPALPHNKPSSAQAAGGLALLCNLLTAARRRAAYALRANASLFVAEEGRGMGGRALRWRRRGFCALLGSEGRVLRLLLLSPAQLSVPVLVPAAFASAALVNRIHLSTNRGAGGTAGRLRLRGKQRMSSSSHFFSANVASPTLCRCLNRRLLSVLLA